MVCVKFVVNVTQELAADRRTGEKLLHRMVEFSQKLCVYIMPDSASELEADTAKTSDRFDLLSRDIAAVLDDLTSRLAACSKYQACVDEVQLWLTKAEDDVTELMSRIPQCQDPAVYLEQTRLFLTELEENRGKLDELDRLEKCCGIAELSQMYDGFCDRHERLTSDLKVC